MLLLLTTKLLATLFILLANITIMLDTWVLTVGCPGVSSRSCLDPPRPPVPPPHGGLQVLEPEDPGDQPPRRPGQVLQHEGGGRGGEAPAHHQEGDLQRCGVSLGDS